MKAGSIATILISVLLVLCPMIAFGGEAQDEALRQAAMNLDVDAVKEALAHGANPNAASPTARPMTPFAYLTMGSFSARDLPDGEERLITIATLLAKKGAKLGPFDKGVLFFPISNGQLSLVKFLVQLGASTTRPIEGLTPTEIARKYGQNEVYEFLVSKGGLPVGTQAAAQLALVEAAQNHDIVRMEEALKQGARVNDPDKNGNTPLAATVSIPIYSSEQVRAVSWLLEHGADPNQVGDSGFKDLEGIPLHLFIYMSQSSMNQPNARYPDAREQAESVMSMLLKAGAKVSGMDSHMRTPLHWAAKADNIRGAEILIEQGARVMAKDSDNRTPLDFAESAEMIRLLKAAGAVEN
jgi:ankyrin repeat protein